MAKVFQFMANGFEDIEALIPVDVLRRGGVDIKTVSITGSDVVESAHGVKIHADLTFEDAEAMLDDADLLMLPGGMPGATNLNDHEGVKAALLKQAEKGKMIAAICAAPSILGHKGLLKGKKATCFPGFEKDLVGADACSDLVIKDGKIITGKGPGACIEFGLKLAEILVSADAALNIKAGMQCK